MTRFLGSGWKRLWKEGNTPWDLKGPTPILQWFLKEHSALIQPVIGDVLVPGCGSGWDLAVLKERFRDCNIIGMDISQEAVETARLSNPECRILHGDFFEYKNTTALIYDHTFFCAIKPRIRQEWGRKVSGLLRNGGYVLAVVYPQTNADLINGPPFLVKLGDYESVLPKFKLLFHSTFPANLSNHPRRNPQKETIALFQKIK